jgi:hypothetical protein
MAKASGPPGLSTRTIRENGSDDNVATASAESWTVRAGPWVERWLSQPRHAVYLTASQGDPQLALDLYEWNAEISAALLRDLAHLEVGLRNAYDRSLSARWPGPPHWTIAGIPAFAPLWRNRRGRRVDVNLR